MLRIAEFEKVSRERFISDYESTLTFNRYNLNLDKVYDSIVLPKRATAGSAGYDFFLPEKFDIDLAPEQSITVPTGIRCKIDDGWMLAIFPRSGLGFKYQMELSNTVGIIDSDYYDAKNEGHIMIKVVNRSIHNKRLIVEAGQAFAQGIFIPYGITVSDDAKGIRVGGFGSTSK